MYIRLLQLLIGMSLCAWSVPSAARKIQMADSSTASFGSVSVCYYSAECPFANTVAMLRATKPAQEEHNAAEHGGGSAATRGTAASSPVDAPAFQITNTGSTAIGRASLRILADKAAGVVPDVYHIGTIKPGASFVLIPGASNDKKVHPSGGFFAFTGSPLDTSDSGPNANSIKFVFSGFVGQQEVTSGIIKVGKFLKPSTDGTVASLNFLGGPGNADGPCNDCYPITLLANIVAQTTSASLPAK